MVPAYKTGTCKVCGRVMRLAAKGMCMAHYQRYLRTGDPGSPQVAPRTSTKGVCTVDGCGEPRHCRGLCAGHYILHRADLPMDAPHAPRNAEARGAVRHCGAAAGSRLPTSLCKLHTARRQRGQDLTAPPHAKRAKHVGCTAHGCDREHYARGLCRKHYAADQRKRRAKGSG